MSDEQSQNEYTKTDETDANAGHFPVFQQLALAIGILFLAFGSTYVSEIRNFVSDNAKDIEEASAELKTQPEPKTSTDDHFEEVDLIARSAFVWDVREQRALYNKNADEQLPLASLTKLMTTLVAYELVDEDESVNISVEAIMEDGDSGLQGGEIFSFKNLADLTLITSSNDGAYALAAGTIGSLFGTSDNTDLFVNAMNIRAEEIGLSQTHFMNVTGLDLSETEAGAYGSARDMTFLMEYILTHYPNLLAETTVEAGTIANAHGATHKVENTNSIVGEIPGLLASKTGFTMLAGGNLVIAYDAGLNRPVIITVLGSTYDGRFSDVKELAERARQQILTTY